MAERTVAFRHTPSVSLDATHVLPVVHCIVEADEVPHKHGYAAIGAPAISEHTGGDEWADVWTNELRATTRARACLDMAYAEAQRSEKGDSLDKLKVTNLSQNGYGGEGEGGAPRRSTEMNTKNDHLFYDMLTKSKDKTHNTDMYKPEMQLPA